MLTTPDREKIILRTSYIGISVNVFLAIMKTLVGLMTHSVAIILDAVNNTTDVASSLITIIGTKIASRPADKRHPYGHGRVEYMSAAIIGAIIGYAGLSALWEAIQRILSPSDVNYTPITLILIAIGVLAKIFLGKHVKTVGEKVNSGNLIASGEDALMDAILTSATLASALLNFFFGWQIDGYLGVIIAAMILRTAWEVWHEATDSITGLRANNNLINQVKAAINHFDEVQGTYDLTLHDYGPGRFIGTAHIQVADKMTACDIHHLTRHIEAMIYKQFGIIMTIGIYAANTSGHSGRIKKELDAIVAQYPSILQVHGFYVDESTQHIFFDVIFDFNQKQPQKIIDEISNALVKEYPHYEVDVIIDTDASEE